MKEFSQTKPIGVAGHAPPQHSALNISKEKCSYEDCGTRHSMPNDAMPAEGGWHDKHEATRHSRRAANHRFK